MKEFEDLGSRIQGLRGKGVTDTGFRVQGFDGQFGSIDLEKG